MAKGCWRVSTVKIHKGKAGRRLAVRMVMEYHTGTLPRTPFAASRRSPRWEACHLILSRLWLPTNQVPLPPQGKTRLSGTNSCHPASRWDYGSWAFESICVYGGNAGKPYNRASPGENRQTALRAMEMHPFCRLSATSSPEGQILAALCFEVLMRPKAEQRANFPLRGKSRVAG